MEGKKVTVPDMSVCRERRAAIQKEMITQYGTAVVCFCLNIPGPVKTNEKIRTVFAVGKQALMHEMKSCGAVIRKSVEIHEASGDELILAADMDSKKLKEITVKIEENHPLGRLFDMDVLDKNGEKLSRPDFRKCLICGRQAQLCARSRRHTVEELQAAVERLTEKYTEF